MGLVGSIFGLGKLRFGITRPPFCIERFHVGCRAGTESRAMPAA